MLYSSIIDIYPLISTLFKKLSALAIHQYTLQLLGGILFLFFEDNIVLLIRAESLE
jgi:hypothetical protein